MQLPLSASALVPVGVGAVLAGVLLILVILTARRRCPARGAATLGAGSAATAGRDVAGPGDAGPQVVGIDAEAPPEPVDGPPDERIAGATSPTGTTAPDTAAREPCPDAPEPADPAVPVAGAADPRSTAEPPAVPPLSGLTRLSVDRQQAGSSRSVAAAVAQAFAVRAAASGADAAMPRWGTNGARRQQGPEVQRDGSQGVPGSNGAPYDRDGGNPARELPPSPVPEPAEALTPGGGPEHPAEPQPAAGADDDRDAAAGTRVEEPASEPGEQDPGPADRPVPCFESDGDGRAAAAPTGATAWTDGRGAVPPRPERASAGASRPQPPARAGVPGRTTPDARDRLLAVLLDDPGHTVGTTEELVRCMRVLERLTDAVRHEREVLCDVLRRLADDGLCPEQLARLAGLPLAEVEALLAPAQRQAQ